MGSALNFCPIRRTKWCKLIDWLTPGLKTAIWDNRAAYHTATFDFEVLGPRSGHRVVGLGEKPYLDPNSMSKREYLALKHG